MRKQQNELVGSGRRPTLTEDQEKVLAKCIGTMCQLGFSPTRNQIKDMVQEFVQLHNIEKKRPSIHLSRIRLRNILKTRKRGGTCKIRKKFQLSHVVQTGDDLLFPLRYHE